MTTLPTYADVEAAARRLDGIAHRTPVLTSRTADQMFGAQLFFKCENFQRMGAFKVRGGYNALAKFTPEQRKRGALAFSSGNHAQAVALAARILQIPAVILMPHDAPAAKVAATRGYGAEVIFYDRLKDDREAFARRIADERGMTLVPPYDHPQIMAGAGTAGLELAEEVSNLDAVLIPVGGGGLISGSAIAIHGVQPQARVFGVEPDSADDTRRSLRAGERVSIPPPPTVADGLRITKPGALTFPVVQQEVEDVLLVSDEAILDAVRFALLRLKLVIEPSGAATLAAVMANRLPDDARRVGVIISGGNIDPALLGTVAAASDARASV
jgi:threonine dehydratase